MAKNRRQARNHMDIPLTWEVVIYHLVAADYDRLIVIDRLMHS